MAETAHDLQTVLDAIKGEGRWRPEKQGVITNSFGNISNIAARLGVQRQTVYNYKKKWKAVEAAIHDALEMRKDFIEDRMLRRVMDGSDTMMIFFAKTQMKDRGYVERQEISGPDGGPVSQSSVSYTADEWRAEQERRRKEAAETMSKFEDAI